MPDEDSKPDEIPANLDSLTDEQMDEHIARMYPEHEKLNEVAPQSQICGDFLYWLSERYSLYREDTDEFIDITEARIPILLAAYFDIDRKKLAEEKDQMLKVMLDLSEEIITEMQTPL